MSPAAWGFAGVLITQLVIVAGLALNRRDTKSIGTAVNHVGKGEPTLIARVRRLETTSDERWAWEVSALEAIARNTGTALPPCDHNQGATP